MSIRGCLPNRKSKIKIRNSNLWLLPLTFLWWQLLRHLSVEWSVNPQYAYGYAVPFLSVYLLWRRLKQTPTPAEQDPVIAQDSTPAAVLTTPRTRARNVSLAILALLWFPTRVIQEANPDWRLVTWAMALEVVAMTWLVVKTVDWPGSPRARAWGFPLAFFLVAVPWPTLIEQPIIQGLARVITSATVEIMNLLGIPALAHGNIIEVGPGSVGIDEACSGIRSLQATLMVALFCGELFRLTLPGRLIAVFGGFGCACVTNLLRTTLLATIAASHGLGTSAKWHDLIGTTLLVACFFGIAWLSKRLARLRFGVRWQAKRDTAFGNTGLPPNEPRERKAAWRAWRPFPPHSIVSWPSAVALTIWLLLAELGTEAWYRAHETALPTPVTWTIALPEKNPSLRKLPLPEDARRQLRCDEAINGIWDESSGLKCQAVYLRWKAGRAAAYLAHTHTPDICLTAAGCELLSASGLTPVSVHGSKLPFRSLLFRDRSGVMRVFHCLWQDRGSTHENEPVALNYSRRLGVVLAGQRNCGQRSLELAFWGVSDDATAESVLQQTVAELVRASAQDK